MASEQVIIARIGAPHGVRGDVRVKAFTAQPAAIRSYGPLTSADGRRFEIETLRPVGASPDMLVVHFKGVADRDAAAALTGTDLTVSRSRLPAPADEDEFYQADLIGLAAVAPTGEVLGRVAAVVNYGAGDLLEIAVPTGPSFFLAFTKENVPAVDVASRHLTVVLPGEIEGDGG